MCTSASPVELIDISEFQRIDLRVGLIREAERIPGSKKLLKLIVDLGSEVRQIIAGLAEWYEPRDLIGKRVVVVANLKSKRFMGYESQGMILATCNHSKPALVTVLDEVKPGSKVC